MAQSNRRLAVAGELRPPGDKSVTHRVMMLAALGQGTSEVRGPLISEDTRSTARVLRQLGAKVGPLGSGSILRITGASWTEPSGTLHCGNAGTTARLMLGLLAGHPFAARLTGDRSLRRRPMRRVIEPLEAMGARFETRTGRLPVVAHGGPLMPLAYRSEVASAQVKSAVLFAGLVGGVDVTVAEPARSRDHTERVLRYLGANVDTQGTLVRLHADSGPRALPCFRLTVPGDFSSAIFPIALALLADTGELTIAEVGLNPTRTGAIDVLRRMGADLAVTEPRLEGGEPIGGIVVRPSALEGTTVASEEIPTLIDEVPMLAVLAARARGETRFHGVGELRVKESDRLALITANLRAVGADAAVEGDDLVVQGGWDAPPEGRVETAGDHRLAMAFGVLATLPGARVELSETASVAVSYPGFVDDLARARHG